MVCKYLKIYQPEEDMGDAACTLDFQEAHKCPIQNDGYHTQECYSVQNNPVEEQKEEKKNESNSST